MTDPSLPDHAVDLPEGELLVLAGADALAFAQAQLMNDVQVLATGRWQWNGWLDAKGRVQALFGLLREDDGQLLAWLPAGGAQDLATALGRFRFRSRLQLRPDPARRLAGFPGPAPDLPGVLALPADPALGERHLRLLARGGGQTDARAADAWHAADLRMGLPWLRPDGPGAGRFVPQWLGLDALPALSLRKGCYPGQEIVARMHYLGQSKRAAFLLTGSGPLPVAGAQVVASDGAVLGLIADAVPQAAGWLALASLNAADAERVAGVTGTGAEPFPARLQGRPAAARPVT